MVVTLRQSASPIAIGDREFVLREQNGEEQERYAAALKTLEQPAKDEKDTRQQRFSNILTVLLHPVDGKAVKADWLKANCNPERVCLQAMAEQLDLNDTGEESGNLLRRQGIAPPPAAAESP